MPLYKRYSHLSRYRDIANILFKHGLGYVIDILGFREFLSYRMKFFKREKAKLPLSLAQRIRMVLEELGPTFIKFGQLLSTRSDIIPAEIIKELEKLQDDVPPFSFEDVKTQIQNELGGSISEFFSEFEKKTLAAASIGQVHRAVLKNGENVVVKVQRPGIEKIVERDLDVLFDIARIAERRTEIGKIYSLTELVEEFARIIKEEMDYTREGRNADKFRKNFSNLNYIQIPKVYWQFTTKRVLTMEMVKGIKISNITKIKEMGFDSNLIAEKLARVFLKQVLIDGFFHGDPHPGNIFITEKGQIALMDFGVVGRIDDDLKFRFVNLILDIIKKDTDSIARDVLQIGIIKRKVDFRELKKDIREIFQKYSELPLIEISIGESLREVMGLAYKYNVVIPSDLTLLAKTTITLEGIIKNLSPAVSLIEMAEPFGRELIKERFSLRYIKRRTMENISELSIVLSSIPIKIHSILEKMEEGKIRLNLQHTNLDKLISKLDIISNRLSFSIIVASLIVGSSLIAQRSPNSFLWGLPVAEIGFIMAGIMGFWLLISILRSGRF
jgi:ubiquinone biosynthesis protein